MVIGVFLHLIALTLRKMYDALYWHICNTYAYILRVIQLCCSILKDVDATLAGAS